MIRHIHVDQGRRATNITTGSNHPILRVDDEQGAELMKGHLIDLVCSCGCRVASFVQPSPDRAHVLVADDTVSLVNYEEKP